MNPVRGYRVVCADPRLPSATFDTLTEAEDYRAWCDSKPSFSCSPHTVECLTGDWHPVEVVA